MLMAIGWIAFLIVVAFFLVRPSGGCDESGPLPVSTGMHCLAVIAMAIVISVAVVWFVS